MRLMTGVWHWRVCLVGAVLGAWGCDEGATRQASSPKAEDPPTENEHPDDEPPPDAHAIEPDEDGNVECSMLASVCHASDTGTADLGDVCHDLGHRGNASDCESMYDECLDYCLDD